LDVAGTANNSGRNVRLIQSQDHRPMNDFPSAEYFRTQASQLREFAEETDDPELAAMYKKLASQFEVKAWSVAVEEPLH